MHLNSNDYLMKLQPTTEINSQAFYKRRNFDEYECYRIKLDFNSQSKHPRAIQAEGT